MKATVNSAMAFLKRHRFLMIALITLAVMAVVWVMPLRASLSYLQFQTDAIPEQTPVTVEVYSDAAYHKSYTINTYVEQSRFKLQMAKNFLPVDRVVIVEDEVAQSIVAMDVRQSILKAADHSCASLEGNVMTMNADGSYVLSEDALDVIAQGTASRTMQRGLLTMLALMIGGLAMLFTAIHRRFGNIKALLVTGVPIGCGLLLYKAQDNLKERIPMFEWHIPVLIPVLAMLVFVSALIVICLLTDQNSKAAKRVVVAVYVLALLFSAAKMLFYSERVGNTPDETAHIAYIAQMHQTGGILPDYEHMRLGAVLNKNGHDWQFSLPENSTNYLGHPSLYYVAMRFAGGIHFTSETTFTANVFRLRLFSIGMTLVGLTLMLYLGYSRLKASPLVHLLYAAVCTSVPMFAYGASGINNDALTYVTIPLFFWGVLRYLEKRRTFSTYLLIAIGISATVLTKLTAGVMVAVAALIVLGVTLIREKNWKELLKPAFLCTLVVYALPLAYYVLMYARYGHFRPNFFELNPEFAYSSVFYNDPSVRTSHSVVSYFRYFFMNFMRCWTGISSHVSLVKPSFYWGSVQNFALVLIWFVPWLFAKKSLRRQSDYSLGVVAGSLGVAVALVLQYFNGYDGFLSRGYMGGFQSRYYLCMVFVLAFAMALAMQKVLDYLEGDGRHSVWLCHCVECLTALYVGLLFYEDFIYFLLNFRQYLVG